MIITDREAAELEQAKHEAPPVTLPVGEQIAILTLATVLSAATLFVLGSVPVLNGILVFLLLVAAVAIVAQKDESEEG